MGFRVPGVGSGDWGLGKGHTRAGEGALGVLAHLVGTAVVGPICDRGVASVSSSVALKRGRAIQHTASTTLGLGGPLSGSIDYGPRAPQTASLSRNPMAFCSLFRMVTDPGIKRFPDSSVRQKCNVKTRTGVRVGRSGEVG